MENMSNTVVLANGGRIAPCLLIAVCCCLPVTHAAEQEVVAESSPWQWLEGRRNQVSRNVTALGRNLDSWLAGEGIGEQVNETYLRVRFNQQLGSYDGYHSKLKIG